MEGILPRDIPVGNGSLLITFDEDYCLRDIYYPHVGKENHTDGHKFRIGIWVDGSFEWLDKDRWNLRLAYADETLSTHVTGYRQHLQISIHSGDLVDYRENVYIKKITFKNLADRPREIRVFFSHDFHILESPAGDTAYYDPDEKALIHYKGKRYFLISGMREDRHGLDQYATGVKEFHQLEGTWKDAEDGTLQGNPIAQGSVDSTCGFTINIEASGGQVLYYWIAAGLDYADVSHLNKMILRHGAEHFIRRTNNYGRAWLNREEFRFGDLPQPVIDLFKKSLLILRTNIDAGGAIIAANDSDIDQFARDTYSYMWPRDGAFTAYSLDQAGYLGSTRTFFEFCLDLVSEGKESGGYFLHKYHPDGCLGSSWHPWLTDEGKQLPIQEDSTGFVIWALWSNFDRFRDIEFATRLYEGLVIRCGDFLASYRDTKTGLPLPSYDLWEEKWGIHTFTVSAVYAGLRAAENFSSFFGDVERARIYGNAADEIRSATDLHLYSREFNRFLKTIIPRGDGFFADLTVDASTYAPFYFGMFEPNDPRVVGTMEAIREHLWLRTPTGGIARYEGDLYYRLSDGTVDLPGNPWCICTLWLAEWYIAKAQNKDQLHEAIPLLDWVASNALSSGVLAEQFDPFTNRPLSVAPLTWSHATFISTVLEYVKKYEG